MPKRPGAPWLGTSCAGVGAGLAFPALMTLAMPGATERDSGLAPPARRYAAPTPATPWTTDARSVVVERHGQLVLAQRGLEALARALGDPGDELAVDRDVAARVEALERRALDRVLEEVEHRQVDAAQRQVAADLRDAPVEVPRVAEDRQRVLRVVLHRVEHVVEDAQVGIAAELRRLAADERLEGVADRVMVGDRRFVPLVAHHEVVQPRARGRVRDEHPATGAGPRGQHAAHLEKADRLVDRRERDAEARAQLLLRAEPL